MGRGSLRLGDPAVCVVGAAGVCCTKETLSLMNTKFNGRMTSQLLFP